VTGHINLTAPTEQLVANAVRAALAPYDPAGLIGMSCLAPGTDIIFGEAVLALGGRLEVIIPAGDYRDRHVQPRDAARFDELLRRAARIDALPHAKANRSSFDAANRVLLMSCERLLAIWDGVANSEPGGTASVVERARRSGVPVEVIWPAGSHRVWSATQGRSPSRSRSPDQRPT
jgi:hypothetical protein